MNSNHFLGNVFLILRRNFLLINIEKSGKFETPLLRIQHFWAELMNLADQVKLQVLDKLAAWFPNSKCFHVMTNSLKKSHLIKWNSDKKLLAWWSFINMLEQLLVKLKCKKSCSWKIFNHPLVDIGGEGVDQGWACQTPGQDTTVQEAMTLPCVLSKTLTYQCASLYQGI